MSERKYQSPVACERRTVCDMAALLAGKDGCQNPERVALVFDQLQWLLDVLGKESEVFTYSDLQKRMFPWLTVDKLRHTIRQLRDMDFINITHEKNDGIRYSLGGGATRQSGDTRHPGPATAASPTLLEIKEENSLAEAAAPATETVDSLLSRMNKAIAKDRTQKIRLHYPSLEELEQQIDGYFQSWHQFKTITLPLENKTQEITAASAATQLAAIFEMQNRYNLDADAMRHGFTTAIAKGVGNINFVIKCARRYRA